MTSSARELAAPPSSLRDWYLRDWYPLESSPEVLTQLARHWDLPPAYTFTDVLGLDAELLALVPRPVHACVLLFPDTEGIVAARTAEGAGARIDGGDGDVPLWIQQEGVGHSCGTFAVVHCLAATGLAPALAPFFAACRVADGPGRTRLFAASPLIKPAHNAVTTAGQTRVRDSDWTDCDHFIAFVAHAGRLWEMDGNTPREGPLDRGPCVDILADTARVVREVYLPHAGNSLNFSLMALVGGGDEGEATT